MSDGSASGNASQSKSLMYMMVGFFFGTVALLGVGFLLVNRVINTVGLSASGNANTVRTSSGSYTLEKLDQIGPALPVYPRGTLELPAVSDTPAALKQAQAGITVSTYHTTDARDFVESWYGQHLNPEFKVRDTESKTATEILRAASVSEKDKAFIAERGSRTRVVVLSEDEGGTKILLIRADKPSESGENHP
jgi:hypothetical protein